MSNFNTVAELSPLYRKAHERWKLVDALMDGLPAMLECGYIKKEINEPQERYEARVARTALTNFYRRTVNSHAGKLFAKAIETNGFSSNMELWLEDINLDGQNLTQFARQVFLDAYNKGVSFILTDMQRVPSIIDEATGQPRKRTAKDDAADGVRPYLVHIPAGNVIGHRTLMLNGQNVLIQFHYFEDIHEYSDDPFVPTPVRQIKVLRPGSWQIFRQDENEDWQLYDEGQTGLSVIPLTPYYTNRGVANYVGTPPLEDLADKTLQYYMQENDLDHNIHFGLVPMLQFRGPQPQNIIETTDDDGVPVTVEQLTDLVIGPNVVTYTGDASNYLEIVESKGTVQTTAMKRLDLLRTEMELIGLAPLVNTARTATEAALNSFEADRSLQSCAEGLEDALAQALLFMNEYQIPTETVGEIIVNKEYGFSDPTEAAKQGNKAIQGGNKVQSQDVVDPNAE